MDVTHAGHTKAAVEGATAPHLDLEVAQAVQGDGLAVAPLDGQLPGGCQEGCAVLSGEAPLQRPVPEWRSSQSSTASPGTECA